MQTAERNLPWTSSGSFREAMDILSSSSSGTRRTPHTLQGQSMANQLDSLSSASSLSPNIVRIMNSIGQKKEQADNFPYWRDHLTMSDCELIAKRNTHYGHNFYDQLFNMTYINLSVRLNERYRGVIKTHLPFVIKVENGIEATYASIKHANTAIWTALSRVSEEFEVPIPDLTVMRFHPDVDKGVEIHMVDGEVCKGESLLTHELRHFKGVHGSKYIVWDFDISNDRIISSGGVAKSYDGGGIIATLEPRYPSGSDFKSALQKNVTQAMLIIRQKAAYRFLKQEYKDKIEELAALDPKQVSILLAQANSEVLGLKSPKLIEGSQIETRIYPWEDEYERKRREIFE